MVLEFESVEEVVIVCPEIRTTWYVSYLPSPFKVKPFSR